MDALLSLVVGEIIEIDVVGVVIDKLTGVNGLLIDEEVDVIVGVTVFVSK